MPTSRRRHAVTETDDVAAALDEAARRWPDVPRAQLIPLVLKEWADSAGIERQRAARRALIGSLPASAEVYDRDEDWPR